MTMPTTTEDDHHHDYDDEVRSKIARACGDCGWNTFTTSEIQNAALGSCRFIASQNTVTFNAIVARTLAILPNGAGDGRIIFGF
jgi:hypothetical protein